MSSRSRMFCSANDAVAEAQSRAASGRRRSARRRRRVLETLVVMLGVVMLLPTSALAFRFPFLGSLHEVTEIGSTEPANHDKNPYGIVTVPRSVGTLVRGDVLISNFNNESNLQGTGSTLVELSPDGSLTLFAQINARTLPGSCPGGVGLTTALTILPDGYVVVGSLPSVNGKAETAGAGCLIVLNPNGHVVSTISGAPINGPWDMTSVSGFGYSALFVTNVLNGTVAGGETPTDEGTVVRVILNTGPGHPPQVVSEREIATGFPEETSEAAFVVGPTGVALGENGALYVADTADNRIAAVPFALFRQSPIGGGGFTVTSGENLSSPLGMTLASNGDILTANGGNGNIVETTPFGLQFEPVDTGAGEGGLFGLTLTPNGKGVYFVDDANNSLGLLQSHADHGHMQ
jgi:hypothetical protein